MSPQVWPKNPETAPEMVAEMVPEMVRDHTWHCEKRPEAPTAAEAGPATSVAVVCRPPHGDEVSAGNHQGSRLHQGLELEVQCFTPKFEHMEMSLHDGLMFGNWDSRLW